jgi:hypothetical protein
VDPIVPTEWGRRLRPNFNIVPHTWETAMAHFQPSSGTFKVFFFLVTLLLVAMKIPESHIFPNFHDLEILQKERLVRQKVLLGSETSLFHVTTSFIF